MLSRTSDQYPRAVIPFGGGGRVYPPFKYGVDGIHELVACNNILKEKQNATRGEVEVKTLLKPNQHQMKRKLRRSQASLRIESN
jgi:uncharacterized ParB-like nuclease family protein